MKKLFTIAVITLLAACTKDNSSPSCQKWEVKKTCEPKQHGVACTPVEWMTESICGDRLKDARPGNQVVYFENESVRMSMLFIKKAQ